MGKTKKYLIGMTAGGIMAGGTALFLLKRRANTNPYDDLDMPIKRKNSAFKDAKDTLCNLKDQISTIKNEGMPAVKSTISDISSLVKTFQKEIQPHLSQIKDDLGELEKTKEKLETETAKPSPI